MTTDGPAFYSIGTITDEIPVAISYQIIGLFSEGLYSSPNKALEELVSNSFDADATLVHVLLSPDRADPNGYITVIDNGTGMDDAGLRTHWLVGTSVKSRNRTTPTGRKTIGKFGIGKLAAYVLGNRLTHITKQHGKYYSTSMDFKRIPAPTEPQSQSTSTEDGPIQLSLLELTEEEARSAVERWFTTDDGLRGLRMFGDGCAESWTVAIISDLRAMAADISTARLKWILSTAMPLRDDFKLYLNDQKVASSKLSQPMIGKWTLGNEIRQVPAPCSTEFEPEINPLIAAPAYKHWQLTHPAIGPVSGYLEVYEDAIDGGKSANLIGRSHGFFVYVHGRLINAEDSGFGIDRNQLRHGTFSRFRVVVDIDRLDHYLRSSRENLQDVPALNIVRDLLRGIFNFARRQLDDHVEKQAKERRASDRLSESPAGLTERPILRMVADTFSADGQAARHLAPIDRTKYPTAETLIAEIEARVTDGRGLVTSVIYGEVGTLAPIAQLDAATGQLTINLDHPFVAHFADEFGDNKKNLPLQLFATSEVVFEAQLREADISDSAVKLILDTRDELLRYLAKSSGAENSLTVAQRLLASVSNESELEAAVVDSFDQLGFAAIPKGKNGEADGLAEAHLPARDGEVRGYRVSLEAKSKRNAGAKVKKSDVEVATIARHRDDLACDHAIVVGPDFETGKDDLGAVIQEIDADRRSNPTKTITLMRAADLAHLVRISPVKRVGIDELRSLFECRSPDEAAAWVDKIANRSVTDGPHVAILTTLWKLQIDDKEHAVEYSALRTALRYEAKLTISDTDLKDECIALSRMAPNLFVARNDRVELNSKPEKILELIHAYVEKAPTTDD
ncbi:hypothetical protein FHT40_002447 [Mycolicibacterium sp. BK556]|uniref:ATP-binding protein n=1 Tax=unclassified Mycolicibacterium TaxID=2636767 RepID=UPI0016106A76|nr:MULTISPECIES: ATP-binding protein [unclassified Mycolicibacterium]MBB3602786.1 hypothetical protein [Mycolicibacterium sp. BK556]MBB3632981.1 hypothetical protein [Mycolicibacterium sp. BK607]